MLGVSREAVKGILAGDENCSLLHTAQSTQSSPKASPFPKATGSDVSLPLILNSPVLTSSSSWAFFMAQTAPRDFAFLSTWTAVPSNLCKTLPFLHQCPIFWQSLLWTLNLSWCL